jgi:hypothetical protein
VWKVEGSNTLLILQRSLCIKGAQKLFSKQLFDLINTELGCTHVVVLTGAGTENIEPSRR